MSHTIRKPTTGLTRLETSTARTMPYASPALGRERAEGYAGHEINKKSPRPDCFVEVKASAISLIFPPCPLCRLGTMHHTIGPPFRTGEPNLDVFLSIKPGIPLSQS